MMQTVPRYWNKLYCLDESIEVSQNINKQKSGGKSLRIGFYGCETKSNGSKSVICKSEKQIEQFVEKMRLVLLMNVQ